MDYSSFYLVYTGCFRRNSEYLGGGRMDYCSFYLVYTGCFRRNSEYLRGGSIE